MTTKTIQKHKVLFILALALVVSLFLFLYRMYQHDVNALKDFSLSYRQFDSAITDFSANKTDVAGSKAFDSLIAFSTRANMRLSSLIKNDGLIMEQAPQVAELAGRELESLRAYAKAIRVNNPLAGMVAKEYGDLTMQRKAAYAHFLELAEMKG